MQNRLVKLQLICSNILQNSSLCETGAHCVKQYTKFQRFKRKLLRERDHNLLSQIIYCTFNNLLHAENLLHVKNLGEYVIKPTTFKKIQGHNL